VTFADVEKSLPNGLHDAELVGLRVDYTEEKAILLLNVDVANHDEDSNLEPNYRGLRLMFLGIQFVVVDPPGGESGAYPGLPVIDAGSGQPETLPIDLPRIRDGYFLCWIFVERWNSFIRISAQSAAFEWTGNPDK